MEMQELEIIIDKEGLMQMKVRGTHGDECLAMTRDLEEAVGTVSERTFDAGFYEQPVMARERQNISR